MKRRSIALSAVVALLSTVITSCANFQSDNSNTEEMPTSSITTEPTETFVVITDVVPTTTSVLTTTTVATTLELTETTQPETTTTTEAQPMTTQPTTQAETTTAPVPTTPEMTTIASTTEAETLTNPPMPTEPAVTSTTTTTTTAAPVVTEEPVIPVIPQTGIQELPAELMQIVQKYQRIYPNMSIGVGIYSMDGNSGYEYNATQLFNGACTIKAAYSLFVCSYCDEHGIDIETEQLYYTSAYHHGGSGVIHDWGYNKWYSVHDLLKYLCDYSDNDAMKLLISRFTMSDFYNFIIPLGGESDWANWNGGRASVQQRRNEWIAIYNYINSDAPNAGNLRKFLTNTRYCYLVKGMQYVPTYMHKSGWCDSYSYPSAADAAIIQNRTGTYLMVVMTQDYSTGNGHTDAIAELGNAIDDYFYSPGFFW